MVSMKEEGATCLQQLGSLLWDILSTLFSSIFSSVALGFRAFLFPSSPITAGTLSLYQGTVFHERRLPIPHKFSYHVRYALVHLDCSPSSFSSTAARYHMTASQARDFAGTTGPVYLLTVPTSVGYEQNPLSVYYCFNNDETYLSVCIAEVTNTPWAERVTFMFDPNGDVVAKPLHVSPFMDMSGAWRIKATLPARDLSITITVQHPELGNYFTASLLAKRVDCALTNIEKSFWHFCFGGKALSFVSIQSMLMVQHIENVLVNMNKNCFVDLHKSSRKEDQLRVVKLILNPHKYQKLVFLESQDIDDHALGVKQIGHGLDLNIENWQSSHGARVLKSMLSKWSYFLIDL